MRRLRTAGLTTPAAIKDRDATTRLDEAARLCGVDGRGRTMAERHAIERAEVSTAALTAALSRRDAIASDHKQPRLVA